MFMVALPPAEPPARVVAGVQVTWPLTKSETELAPGAKLTIRVASKRRSAKLSFVRVNASGKALSTVARRTLRRGSFTVTVPNAAGARYALRVTVAGRKRFSWVTTPAAVAPAPPAPTPAPTPVPLSFCPDTPPQTSADINARITPASPTVKAGETLAFEITNAGPGGFTALGAAKVVPDGQAATAYWVSEAPMTGLRPGESAQRSVLVPAGTTPGMYRIQTEVIWAQCDMLLFKAFAGGTFEVLPG
jgi:hypothetical protein